MGLWYYNVGLSCLRNNLRQHGNRRHVLRNHGLHIGCQTCRDRVLTWSSRLCECAAQPHLGHARCMASECFHQMLAVRAKATVCGPAMHACAGQPCGCDCMRARVQVSTRLPGVISPSGSCLIWGEGDVHMRWIGKAAWLSEGGSKRCRVPGRE